MALGMTIRRTAAMLSIAASLLLAGCAKDSELYPSLAIRDQERVTGAFDPVEPPPDIPPRQGAATQGNLARYRADAADAHKRVLAAAEQARAPLAAARGKDTGGDEWASASIALANVEAARSETMIALAEIDLLYVAAQTQAGELGAIVGALSEVNAMVLEEDRLIATLYRDLAQ
jgi:hypothetical protein